MSQLIKGMIIGSAITLAAAGGYAFGTSSGPVQGQFQDESKDLERGECTVSVGYGRLSVGSECRMNQVMVGTRSDYLLCADIEVTCP